MFPYTVFLQLANQSIGLGVETHMKCILHSVPQTTSAVCIINIIIAPLALAIDLVHVLQMPLVIAGRLFIVANQASC